MRMLRTWRNTLQRNRRRGRQRRKCLWRKSRSYTHIPQDLGVNLKATEPPHKCFIPKRQIHSWSGHTKGVSVIRWFPTSAHLILSGSMDNKVKLWETETGDVIGRFSNKKMAF